MKGRILIVDDEQDITSVFKQALEGAGYRVDAFNDPADALASFQPGAYDLLLLDILMPGTSGFMLYKEIRKIDDRPKVCFITAFDVYYDEFKKVFPSMPIKCFIRKPVSQSDLLAQVKAELN